MKQEKWLQAQGKKGFTLAEILIAITVIGVISAITLPVLMQNTNKQEYVTALKKTYSTLSQVTNQITAEEGSPKCLDETGKETGWMCSNNDIYTQFKKRINSAKDCGFGTGCFEQLSKSGVNYKWLNGSRTESSSWQYNTRADVPKLILADGVQLFFIDTKKDCSADSYGSYKHCGIIGADLNGEKNPNQWGRDVFKFVIKENGLYPIGCDYDNYCDEKIKGNTSKSGVGCACRVLREGAMNY